MEESICPVCGEPLPNPRRPTMKYHPTCRVKYHNSRRTLRSGYNEAQRLRAANRWQQETERVKFRQWGRSSYARIRQEVLTHYGGACRCCGEATDEFLSIDHIDGGGSQHRKRLNRYGGKMYRWLKALGYPPGFRVLCHNCNFARGRYGYCPHERGAGHADHIAALNIARRGMLVAGLPVTQPNVSDAAVTPHASPSPVVSPVAPETSGLL
jgi:hypothetical protein